MCSGTLKQRHVHQTVEGSNEQDRVSVGDIVWLKDTVNKEFYREKVGWRSSWWKWGNYMCKT